MELVRGWHSSSSHMGNVGGGGWMAPLCSPATPRGGQGMLLRHSASQQELLRLDSVNSEDEQAAYQELQVRAR